MPDIKALWALAFIAAAVAAYTIPVQGDLTVRFENFSINNQANVFVYETDGDFTAESALEGFAPEGPGPGLSVLDDVRFAVNFSYSSQVEDQFRARGLFERAMNLYTSGDYDAALGSIDESLEAFRSSTGSWTLKGIILQAKNDSAEAVDAYDTALSLDASNVPAWNNRGVALFALARPDEALSSLDAALAIDPLNTAAINNRSIMLRALGRGEAA